MTDMRASPCRRHWAVGFALLAVVGPISAAAAEAPPQRADVPDGAALAAAEALFRDVYGKDLAAAKSADQKAALAARLLRQAEEVRGDPAVRFVLLRESVELATAGGDTETALRGLSESAASYRLPTAGRLERLTALRGGARGPDRLAAVAAAAEALALEAAGEDDLVSARKAADLAVAAAAASRRTDAQKSARAVRDQVVAIAAAAAQVADAAAKLRTTPDDPDANQAVGLYRCLMLGDWAGGLPLLAKGRDPDTRAAAVGDLAGADQPAAQVGIGDLWWELSLREKDGSPSRAALRRRAAAWYAKAAPGLTGLLRLKADQRIAEAGPPPTTGNPAAAPAAVSGEGLVFLWTSATGPNRISDPIRKTSRPAVLKPRGKSAVRNGEIDLAEGAVEVVGADEALLEACRRSGELTIEAVITPADAAQRGPARIISFSSDAGDGRNFTLGQAADALVLRLRVGKDGVKELRIAGGLSAGRPHHVVVSYKSGLLTCHVDGREASSTKELTGDFAEWKPLHLILGDEWDGNRRWSGTLDGVAVLARAVSPAEAAARYKAAEQRRRAAGRPLPAPAK
jgi:hypothetical protein